MRDLAKRKKNGHWLITASASGTSFVKVLRGHETVPPAKIDLWLGTAMAIVRIGGGNELLSELMVCLKHDQPDMIVHALDAIGSMGPKAKVAVPEVEVLRKRPNEKVRQAAEQAIELIGK